MPLFGLALGAPLGHAIGGAADYLAIGVLIAFGIYTLTAEDDDARLAELAEMKAGAFAASLLGSASASTNSRSASRSVCCTSPQRS